MDSDTTQEVVNKALDLAKQGITTLYLGVQKMAPEVWKMALRQTVLNGVECLIGSALSVGVLIASKYVFRALYKTEEYSDARLGYFILLLVMVSSGIIGFTVCTINAIDLIGNPTYWTLARIFQMTKGNF